MEYRNEFKYTCTQAEFIELQNRLQSIMHVDKHIKSHEGYNIRSVYFDDYEDTYFHENDAGVNERFKIRIRIYDKDAKVIKLEIKSKKNGFVKKESCTITKDICESLLQGVCPPFEQCTHDVLRKFFVLMQTRYLMPKVIVEYERYAFIDDLGNVRVTFDKNIRASKDYTRFFENDMYPQLIQENNKHVLEVKYDEFLPEYIASGLELKILQKTAFSKYYIARMHLEENNGIYRNY